MIIVNWNTINKLLMQNNFTIPISIIKHKILINENNIMTVQF